jgi:hypothetical protein
VAENGGMTIFGRWERARPETTLLFDPVTQFGIGRLLELFVYLSPFNSYSIFFLFPCKVPLDKFSGRESPEKILPIRPPKGTF